MVHIPKWKVPRFRRFTAIGLVGAMALAASATALVPAAGASPARQSSPGESALALANSFSGEVHGFGVYPDGNANVVVVPSNAPATAATMAQHAQEVSRSSVRLRRSQFTTAEMSAFSALAGSRARLGIPEKYSLVSYYDPQKDKFEVASDAPAAVLKSVALKHVGKIDVSFGSLQLADYRFSANYPFFGASAIKSDWGYCTSGVGVMNAFGAVFMTIAAHCAPLGAKVYMRAGQLIGTVAYRNPSIDTDLVETDAGGRIWTGGWYYSISTLAVGYMIQPYLGLSNIYTSGATTYNQPNKRVVEVNVNMCIGGGVCIPGGFCLAGGKQSASGDSGGPIYIESAGKASIIGMIVGEEGTTTCGVQLATVMHDYTLRLIH